MEEPRKKQPGFTILKNDSTSGHGGYGVGVLSLENVSPVIVDVAEGTAVVDIAAMHARSEVEKGIKFSPNKEEVVNGKAYWLVWVTIEQLQTGAYYAGVTACEMIIDREARRGYKLLPEHVNRMDKSLKRHIIVDHMDEPSKIVLGQFLKQHNPNMWNASSEKLKKELLGE